jgi:Tfp pilus assembly protein PilE
LVELIVTVAIIGILALIAIPRFAVYRYNAYNGSAESTAKNFDISEGAYKAIHEEYATDVQQLLTIDKALLSTPDVTFVWVESGGSKYTVNFKHLHGNRWYTAQAQR